MNFLPKEIEDIILDYKSQLEHYEKFKKCLNDINSFKYEIIDETIKYGEDEDDVLYKHYSRRISPYKKNMKVEYEYRGSKYLGGFNNQINEEVLYIDTIGLTMDGGKEVEYSTGMSLRNPVFKDIDYNYDYNSRQVVILKILYYIGKYEPDYNKTHQSEFIINHLCYSVKCNSCKEIKYQYRDDEKYICFDCKYPELYEDLNMKNKKKIDF